MNARVIAITCEITCEKSLPKYTFVSFFDGKKADKTIFEEMHKLRFIHGFTSQIIVSSFLHETDEMIFQSILLVAIIILI